MVVVPEVRDLDLAAAAEEPPDTRQVIHIWVAAPDPSTAAVLGLVALVYIVGNVVQGLAVVWEAPYWARSGGWPSSRRMTPDDSKAYDEAFRQLLETKLDKLAGTETAAMSINERFGLARAELRRQGQDTRSSRSTRPMD